MPQATRRPVFSSFTILLYLLMFVCVFAFAAEFVGPHQGWLERLALRINPEGIDQPAEDLPDDEPPEDEPVDDKPPDDADPVDDDGGEEPKKPANDDLEELYETYYKAYLEAAERPEIGKTYKIKLKKGVSIEGELAAVSPATVTLKFKYGTMSLPVHKIHPDSYAQLFPEETARLKAMAKVESTIRERELAASLARNEPPPEPPEPAPSPEASPAVILQARGEVAYDPSSAKTPEELQHTIKEFGFWLNAQQKRMNFTFARRMHAKRHGNSVVLYMTMAPDFRRLSYDQRYALVESLWRFWSMRCRTNHMVNTVQDAHVVLTTGETEDDIIGGSEPENGSRLWVQDG